MWPIHTYTYTYTITQQRQSKKQRSKKQRSKKAEKQKRPRDLSVVLAGIPTVSQNDRFRSLAKHRPRCGFIAAATWKWTFSNPLQVTHACQRFRNVRETLRLPADQEASEILHQSTKRRFGPPNASIPCVKWSWLQKRTQHAGQSAGSLDLLRTSTGVHGFMALFV